VRVNREQSGVIISYQREFIFLKTQKSGGSSIEIALATLCGDDDVLTALPAQEEAVRKSAGRGAQNTIIPDRYQPAWARLLGARKGRLAKGWTRYVNHIDAKTLRSRMDPVLFDRFRKIAIVRNPWDREVSLYFWHTRAETNPPPFSDFVSRWERKPERKTFEIYSIDGRVVANEIWRYERLAEEYTNFVKSLGVDNVPPLPSAKGGIRPKEKKGYHAMYDPKARAIVAKRYAREIEMLGYQFD
jgi:hypothetical protein